MQMLLSSILQYSGIMARKQGILSLRTSPQILIYYSYTTREALYQYYMHWRFVFHFQYSVFKICALFLVFFASSSVVWTSFN